MDTTRNATTDLDTELDELLRSSSHIHHGGTTVLRTDEQAHREELFMQRSRARRTIRVLREQLGRARRRHSKATPVPLDLLDDLLTRIENADT